MRAVDFAPEHYPIVKAWWEARPPWPAMPLEALPKTGVIVFHGESPVCAAWLYSTDSSLSLLEWTISDPNSTHEVRDQALDLLFKSLIERSNGKIICGFSEKPRLTERYKKHGFQVGDHKMDFLIRRPQ